jgi:hypothetical protein
MHKHRNAKVGCRGEERTRFGRIREKIAFGALNEHAAQSKDTNGAP